MAIYEIEGRQFEIPDDVQGEQLISVLESLTEQLKPEPKGFTGASVIEPIGTMLSSMAAVPAGGIAGLATGLLTQDPAAASAVAKGVEESLTFQPTTEKGEAGLRAVGEAFAPVSEVLQAAEKGAGDIGFGVAGPVGGAIGATVPTAIGEALGLFAGRAISKLGKVKTAKAQEAIKALDDAERGIITDKGVSDVVDVIRQGDVEDIATVIDADANFYRAAEEMGITTEPLASFASQNPQFRDVEGALRKVPGSVLDAQAVGFIKETSQRADDLIQQYGGSLDKAQLGLDFKENSLAVIDDLFQQADDSYSKLKEVLPEGNRFEAPETVRFLQDLATKEKIPPKLSRILSELSPKQRAVKGKPTFDFATGRRGPATETVLPTLGKIDQVRKEIGQAINKGSGPFKDVETGLNKAVYARLSTDQDNIAKAAGGDALSVSDTAKGLVRQRKQLEDNLKTLLGNDLNKALNVTVSGALKKLDKGEIDKFNGVMNAIPKNQRGEVLISAMNDVFKGTGVNQAQLSPTGFTKWYDTIKRSPAASKALFGNLPKGSKRAIDNLYEVSRGISRASQQVTPTGRINAMFNPETGFIRKMVGSAGARGVAFATGSHVAGAMTNATLDFINQSSNGAKQASNLMASPEFQNLIRRAVKEGVVDGNAKSKALIQAEKQLSRSNKFKKWADALASDDRAALQGGILTYLFEEEEQN